MFGFFCSSALLSSYDVHEKPHVALIKKNGGSCGMRLQSIILLSLTEFEFHNYSDNIVTL